MKNINDINFRCFKKIYVDCSEIADQGLFAGEGIFEGEVVLSFGGMLAKIEDRYSGMYIPSTFACVTDDIMICESEHSTKDCSDYINHSCNPNLGMYDCLSLVAIRDILPGEELTCDYSFWEADETWKLKNLCNCGQPNCRKNVTGLDWRNIKSTDKAFEYYAPFLKRRILKMEENL